MDFKKYRIFTIPNLLSLFRIFLIPIFIFIYITADSSKESIAAAIIILISSLTDMLDGFIARRFNQISELGKFLDPLADKLTHTAVAVCMAFKVPNMVYLLLLLVVKELFMGVASVVIYKRKGRKLDGAKWFGKLSTIVFDVVIFIMLCLYPYFISIDVSNILILIVGIFLGLSFILYIKEFYIMYKSSSK